MKHLKPPPTHFVFCFLISQGISLNSCFSLLQKYESFVPRLCPKRRLEEITRWSATFCLFFAGSIALRNTFWSYFQMVLVTEFLMEAFSHFSSGFFHQTALAHKWKQSILRLLMESSEEIRPKTPTHEACLYSANTLCEVFHVCALPFPGCLKQETC